MAKDKRKGVSVLDTISNHINGVDVTIPFCGASKLEEIERAGGVCGVIMDVDNVTILKQGRKPPIRTYLIKYTTSP